MPLRGEAVALAVLLLEPESLCSGKQGVLQSVEVFPGAFKVREHGFLWPLSILIYPVALYMFVCSFPEDSR